MKTEKGVFEEGTSELAVKGINPNCYGMLTQPKYY